MTELPSSLLEALRDHYVLERELGRGGMATVYLANDIRHKRPVALKVLHPELAATLGPERFEREIETAARLQHPHILSVIDSGQAAGQLWFTMPYVDGESLRDRLNRERQLSVDDALRIATETARALEYAHRHGVVHRDIKPENLLLTADGSILVADFGIARALAGADDRLTQTGMSVGTPGYMSPEQAAGDRNLDARSDVYSLGCVLYEMLAGEPPFTGATPQSVIAKRFSGEVPHVRRVRPSVPERVDQAITQALAPVAADRFTTAADFSHALASATTLPDAPAVPAASGAISARAETPARRRVPFAATALGLGFLLGLGVLFAWRRSHLGTGDPKGAKVLAVLPFENLGDSADAYFADGVANEIRTKLSQLPGIEVIARTSSNEYRHTTKTSQQIARELGVNFLLTATVQWERHPSGASRVRVSPELVDVSPGHAPRTRWGQQFDASITDVFQVQADVAGQVAGALNVALSDSTRREMAVRPTQNLDAYDAYLRGKEIRAGDVQPSVLHAAEAEFQRAVHLDSTFASAWAELATTHIMLFRMGGVQMRDARAAGREVERATALAPELPDVHAARGLYQQVIRGNARSALAEYEAALRAAPNRSDLLNLVSAAETDLGRSAVGLSHYERAARLDPRSPDVASRLANTYLELRRYPEAQAALDRARALRPASMSLLYNQARLDVAKGDLARARHAFDLAHQVADSSTVVAYVALREDLLWLLNDAEQRLLFTLTPAALDSGRADWALALAETYWMRGNQRRARAYADTANVAYSQQIRQILNPSDRAQSIVLQALALAYLGRKQDAVRRGEEALNLVVRTAAPAWYHSAVQHYLARVYLLLGEPEKAINVLEQLMKVPNQTSPGWLRVDPTYAPLRDNPRFQRLIAGEG